MVPRYGVLNEGRDALVYMTDRAVGWSHRIPRLNAAPWSVASTLLAVVVGVLSAFGAHVALVLFALVALSTVRIRYLIAILIMASFMSGVVIDVAGFGVRIEQVVTLVAIARLWIVLQMRNDPAHWTLPRGFVFLAGGFVLWNMLVSWLYSPDLLASAKMGTWLVADIAIVLVIAAVIAYRLVPVTYMLRAAAVGTLLTGGVATVLWVLSLIGYAGWGLQYDHVTGSMAIKVWAFESNILSSTLAMWTTLLVAHWDLPVTPPQRWLWGASVGFGAAGCLVALSRSGAAAMAVGIATVVLVHWMSSGHRRSRSLMFIGLGGVAATVSLLSPHVVSKVKRLFEFSSSTGFVRAETWRTALSDLGELDAWVLGLGLNSFGQRHLWLTDTGQPGYISNFFIQVLYDGGLVASGLVLLGAVGLIYRAARWRHLVDPAPIMGWGSVFAVASIATSTVWLGSTWVAFALALTTPAGARGELLEHTR